MKLNIKETNLEPIRKALTYTDSKQAISVSDEDVDNLFEKATILSLDTSHGVNVKDALQKLDTKILDYEKATKAIFVIACSSSYPLPVSELADISLYINDNLPHVDIRWGFAVMKESKNNVTVMAVTTY